MRTTNPHTAARGLLFSQKPSPVLSFDGILYHIRDASEEPGKDSYAILTKDQALDHKPVFRRGCTFSDLVGDWIKAEAQTWLASARLAASWEDSSAGSEPALRATSNA